MPKRSAFLKNGFAILRSSTVQSLWILVVFPNSPNEMIDEDFNKLLESLDDNRFMTAVYCTFF